MQSARRVEAKKRVGKYDLGRTLGEGTFGKVKVGRHVETRQKVAIKILDRQMIQEHKMGEQIKREISIMQLVQHKHVVNLIEVLASRDKIFIVLELVTGGELFDKIVAMGRMDESMARKYFHQLIRGLEYCHSKGVCHRDLKPENLLLDEKGDLKISDFGLSALYKQNTEDELLKTSCGTPNYASPEVLENKGYDGKMSDVWSCGVILYVLMAGFLPFEDDNMLILFRRIMKADYRYPTWFSHRAKAFISRILVTDPKKRISIQEMKEDPWFKIGWKETEDEDVDGGDDDVEDVDVAARSLARSMLERTLSEQDLSTEMTETRSGLASMNAFELIFQGLDIGAMFLQDKDESHLKYTRFTTQHPPEEVLERIDRGATEVPNTANMEAKIDLKQSGIRITYRNFRGLMTVTAQVYVMVPGLYMVEFRRRKGDLLEYHRFFKHLYSLCRDLVTRGDKEEGDFVSAVEGSMVNTSQVLSQHGEKEKKSKGKEEAKEERQSEIEVAKATPTSDANMADVGLYRLQNE